MKQLLYILTGVLLLSACSRFSFQEESDEVQQLIYSYDSLLAEVHKMPIDSINSFYKEYKKSFKALQEEIATLEIEDLNDLSFLSHYTGVKKGLRRMEKMRREWEDKILKNSRELKVLQKDIENRAVSKEQLKAYLKEEKRHFESLEKHFHSTIAKAYRQKEVLDSLNLEMPKHLNALKK